MLGIRFQVKLSASAVLDAQNAWIRRDFVGLSINGNKAVLRKKGINLG